MKHPTSSIRFLSCFVPIGVASILLHGGVLALPCRTVASSQAEGVKGSLIDLKVGPGSGLNILVPEGETVENVWLDDMSQIGVASNGRLCQWSDQAQTDCQNEGASVLHLRQIGKINFPNLPRSADGSTLLTLIPEGAQKRKVYHFKVTPISKAPDYQCIIIQPDSGITDSIASLDPVENPAAIAKQVTPISTQERQAQGEALQPQQAQNPNQNNFSTTQARRLVAQEKPVVSLKKTDTSSVREQSLSKAINDAQAAQKGLKIANKADLFQPLTVPWWRATRAISYLEEGDSVPEAAEKSGLHIFLLAQLVSWGREAEANLVSFH